MHLTVGQQLQLTNIYKFRYSFVYLRFDLEDTIPKYAIVANNMNVFILNPNINSRVHILIVARLNNIQCYSKS